MYCCSVQFINQGFKCLVEHNFLILKFHCLMLLLNSITSKYSLEGLFSYATSIPRYLASFWQVPHRHKHFLYCSSSLGLLPAPIVLRALANLLE